MNGIHRRAGTYLSCTAFLFVSVVTGSFASANHVPTILDVPGIRDPLPNEGYLAHTVNPAAGRFGEEWTGWVDVRHPSLLGATDTAFGYDRSDRRYDVRSNILTDAANKTAAPNRVRDFDFANKAYMLQAGVSVIETSSRGVTSGAGGAPAFTFGLSFAEEQAIMPAMNAAAPTVENYYAGTNGGANSLDSAAFGETYNPSLIGGAARNEAIFMADVPAPRTDTFSHELYHFAGDGQAVQSPNGGDPAHSTDPANLIASGGIRSIPGNTSEIGPRMSGTVGGKDQLTSAQVTRMFNNAGAAPWLQTSDNGGAAGDHVDWDFVVDHNQFGNDHDNNPGTANVNFGVEGINGADNHPGVESMYWGIQPTIASSQVGKDKTGLGVFTPTPDFGGVTFRTADVFSLGLRYSDSDVNDAGTLSQREEDLDYNLFFRLLDGSFVQGVPVRVFIGGWTTNSFADNYLARWLSPADAVGVFIFALNDSGHDGTAQIDAVIVSASAVPEPGAILVWGGGLLLCGLSFHFAKRFGITIG
jgi:hypothetical protein